VIHGRERLSARERGYSAISRAGYYLPSAAGGLIAGGASAALGFSWGPSADDRRPGRGAFFQRAPVPAV
jgi:hypothetical protein